MKVLMIFENETKGAVRFREVDEDGKDVDMLDAKIGTLYMRKKQLPSPPPKAVSVEVTWKKG